MTVGRAGEVVSSAPGRPVDTFDFGRFALHLASSEAVLPVPVLVEEARPEDLRLLSP